MLSEVPANSPILWQPDTTENGPATDFARYPTPQESIIEASS
jgi:hypothetical protein